MFIPRILLCAALALYMSGVAAFDGKDSYKVGDRLKSQAAAHSAYKTITWDDLMPKNWDPMTDFKKLDFSKLKDADPRAQDALTKLREAWNNSPVVPEMNGTRIRIPGFIVPLEESRHQISEFLLVPYFGACIHVPPPPANQIIHVLTAQPLKKNLQSMDAIWASGTLETFPSDTGMGTAGYRMKVDVVEPYKE